MRTLPKAPRPTTRSRRKWLRLAISRLLGQLGRSQGMEMEMQQPSLGPLGGRQRPLHHAPDTWERAKGGRDAVGRDSLGGFLDVPSPVRSTGFPWPLPMMRIGRIGGRESAAGIVNDGERSCCSFAVCGRWQSNAWLAVLFSAMAEESAGQWGAFWSTQSRKWAG